MYMGKTNSDIMTVYQYLMLSTILKKKKWFGFTGIFLGIKSYFPTDFNTFKTCSWTRFLVNKINHQRSPQQNKTAKPWKPIVINAKYKNEVTGKGLYI